MATWLPDHYKIYIKEIFFFSFLYKCIKIAIRGDGKSPDQTTISKFSVFQLISCICPLMKVLLYFPVVFSNSVTGENVTCLHEVYPCVVGYKNKRGPCATACSLEWNSHCRYANVLHHFYNPDIASNERIIILSSSWVWRRRCFDHYFFFTINGMTVSRAWPFEQTLFQQ